MVHNDRLTTMIDTQVLNGSPLDVNNPIDLLQQNKPLQVNTPIKAGIVPSCATCVSSQAISKMSACCYPLVCDQNGWKGSRRDLRLKAIAVLS